MASPASTTEDRIALMQALAVTAELTGTADMSEAAARLMADDLLAYPLSQVLAALTRCRRELKGRLTLAAILERLDDGRPGPQEAWAMIPQDEAGSAVWTDEMALAFGAAQPLMVLGQTIAARQAFLECYERECATARGNRKPVRWTPSLGHDPMQRARALETAVRLGRIAQSQAAALLPSPDRAIANAALVNLARTAPDASEVRRKIAALKLVVGRK